VAENDSQTTPQPPVKPNPDLKSLERLVGTWEVSGGIRGTQTFEWAEGGFFLVHRFDFEQGGREIKGIEIIGRERKMGAEPSAEIKTRLYCFLDGLTLDYVYEADDDAFTYWMGEKGSPSYLTGKFGEDGSTYTGEWVQPGGGYKVFGTKIK
jgi:hypothetical protein